jgi:pimeloyl-ACP methyl ester carboxylesterase
LAENIPNAKAVIIEGPTHWFIIDRPAQTNKVIEEFLATLG